jgi:hypothetical protein
MRTTPNRSVHLRRLHGASLLRVIQPAIVIDLDKRR